MKEKPAIVLRGKSMVFLGIVALASVVLFAWPLFAQPGALAGNDGTAPLYFAVLIPLILALVLAEISEDGFDIKAIAMLGVLSAAVAAVRDDDPHAGWVALQGERWQVRGTAPLRPGQRVRVTARDGVHLQVSAVDEPPPQGGH